MDTDDIGRVAVLGAGNMGHGIAEVAALAGYPVTMQDVDEDALADGHEGIEWSLGKLAEGDAMEQAPADVLARVETTTDLGDAVADADVVVEAAPERMELKRDIFADLAEFTDDAVLASNTSSLSVTDIAAATDDPGRVVGTHFFNPPVKMDLVEVVHGEATTEATAETAYAFAEALGKTPIHVREDVQGFVVNSVLGPFGGEAAWMVSNGEATVRGADATMVHERGYPMGPFELADLTGIDIGYRVRREAGIPVPPVIEEKVEAGELGRKTGRGYYEYGGTPEESRGGGEAASGDGPDYTEADAGDFDWLRVEARMVDEAARLVGGGVATAGAVDTGMRLRAGFPEGPCARGDDLGLDRVLERLRECREATDAERFEPAEYLVELVESGRTGVDAGAGFFEYGD